MQVLEQRSVAHRAEVRVAAAHAAQLRAQLAREQQAVAALGGQLAARDAGAKVQTGRGGAAE